MRSKAKKEKSIMHRRENGTCWLCMTLEGNYLQHKYLEGHHVIYNAHNRKLSDKYGLIIYLCPRHHNEDGSPVAVHRNRQIRTITCIAAQKAFEKKYPELSFTDIFGKNYIYEENQNGATGQNGCERIQTDANGCERIQTDANEN